MARKKKRERNSFSKQYKLNAVKMTLKEGVKVGDVADELGIPPAYLTRWRYKDANDVEAAEARVDAISENQVLKDEL